ncbi:MAG TPA: hypothetical protein VF613_15400 [Longimicrobium sp.]|jgi:hypothetical protein
MRNYGPFRIVAGVLFAAAALVGITRAADADAQARSRLTGVVWMRTTPAEPAGTFRIFLAGGTVMTGSCTETYRIDRWRSNSASRVTITEDGIAIPADLSFNGAELRMRLRLRDGVREERFRPARVPYLCPSTRR